MKGLQASDFQKEDQQKSENKSTKTLSGLPNNKGKFTKSIPYETRLAHLQQDAWNRKCSCEGLKWIAPPFDITHSDFGKLVQCSCAKNIENKKDSLHMFSNLPKGKSFENFKVSFNPKTQYALDRSIRWSDGKSTPFMLLYGATGVGKTHLAVACGKRIIENYQKSVTYYSCSELVREIQSGMSKNGYNRIIDETKCATNLILDDLGREYTTDWITSLFHEIIDYRYNKSLRTFITTNHSLSELEKIVGLPVVSRLKDIVISQIVVMEGEDVRDKSEHFENQNTQKQF